MENNEEIKKRFTFGLLIDWAYSGYHQSILAGIIDFAENRQINLVCFIAGRLNPPDQWEAKKNILFNFISKNRIDGLIILSDSLQSFVGKKEFTLFLKHYEKLPIISISAHFEGYYSVMINDEKGLFDLFDHLVSKHNYKRIAFITGPKENAASNSRLNAYYKFLKSRNIPLNEKLIIEGNFMSMSGRNAVKELLDIRKVRFDCIAAANDDMALGAIEELSGRGIQVPGDTFVVGFDDIENSRLASLTTVRQPIYEQGRKAVETLLDILTDKTSPRDVYLSTEIVIRESCGCQLPGVIEASVWGKEIQPISFEEQFTMNWARVMEDLETCLPPKKYSGIKAEMIDWIKSLCTALVNAYKQLDLEKYLYHWNKMIFWAVSKNLEMSLLYRFISCLRKNALCCRLEPQNSLFLEDIFHQMRIIVEERIHKDTARREMIAALQFSKLTAISGRLAEADSFDDLVSRIYDVLTELGLKTCYLSLYQNPAKPLDFSRLILAFDKKGRADLTEEAVVFKTCDLIPQKFYPQDSRFFIVVQSLNQRHEHQGFIILDLVEYLKNIDTYDKICLELSSTIRLIMLIEKISRQAQYLKDEIKERKNAEKKLNQAKDKLERYNEILHDLSLKDELTGLYNRRGFLTLGEQQLLYSKRNGKSLMLFYCDMDGLKKINDSYGHKEGDFALKKAAQMLKKSFRSVDIIARIGGDEFTVLAVDTVEEDADLLKKRIRTILNDYNALSKKQYPVSVSTGYITVKSDNKYSFNELIGIADKKLYEEKHKKKI